MPAYRGTDWMREPWLSCPEHECDFGGCRRQSFRLRGDVTRTDPAGSRSPEHALIVTARCGRKVAVVYLRSQQLPDSTACPYSRNPVAARPSNAPVDLEPRL